MNAFIITLIVSIIIAIMSAKILWLQEDNRYLRGQVELWHSFYKDEENSKDVLMEENVQLKFELSDLKSQLQLRDEKTGRYIKKHKK
jgi:hypothetical protein